MKNIFFLLVCIVMVSCNPLEKITTRNKPGVEFPNVAFVGANVIPMTGDTVLRNQTVLVSDGKIAAIGDAAATAVPDQFHVVDCKGQYLMPGFTDMHVHISDDGDMLKLLKSGVTTVRHMSDVAGWAKMMGFPDILSLRDKQRKGKVFGPDIYTFGYCLDGKPPVSPMNKKITDSLSAKREVYKEKKAGYDFIKIYDKLTPESYDAIIQYAKAVNMPVAGHVPELVGLDKVLDDRIKSIEHLTGYLDNNTGDYIIPKDRFDFYLDKTKASGVYNCPTLVVWNNLPPENGFDSLQKDPEFKYLAWQVKWLWKTSLSYYYKITYPDKANYSKQMTKITQEFAYKLYSNGCPLLIGTDANVIGTYAGESTLKEMELFAQSGIPNYETLRSATIVAAKALGKEQETGTVETGKRANLILLRENPLEDIHHIRALSYVYAGRFLFTEKGLADMVEQYY